MLFHHQQEILRSWKPTEVAVRLTFGQLQAANTSRFYVMVENGLPWVSH